MNKKTLNILPLEFETRSVCKSLDAKNFLDEVHRLILRTVSQNSSKKLEHMTLKHLEATGKMLRPHIVRDLALCFDLKLEQALPWASSCELLHNATLIHDDIQDGDDTRRGLPAIWKEFGVHQAINVGDFLLTLAPQPIIQSYEYDNRELLSLFTVMSSRIVGGQVDEFELGKFINHQDLLDRYLDCITGKTSTLFAGLAIGVGMTSGQEKSTLRHLEDIFSQLGVIFQIQNDILDFYSGTKDMEQFSDIKEGKISFLVINYLSMHPEKLKTVQIILDKSRELTTIEDIDKIKELFETSRNFSSSVDFIKSKIQKLQSHTYLKENGRLLSIIEELVQKILQPIEVIERARENSCVENRKVL